MALGLPAVPGGCYPSQPGWHAGRAPVASPAFLQTRVAAAEKSWGVESSYFSFCHTIFYCKGREDLFCPPKHQVCISPPHIVFYTKASAAIRSLSVQHDGAQTSPFPGRAVPGQEQNPWHSFLQAHGGAHWGAKHRAREGRRADGGVGPQLPAGEVIAGTADSARHGLSYRKHAGCPAYFTTLDLNAFLTRWA